MQFIDSHVHIWTSDETVYKRRESYPIPGGIDTSKIEINPKHFPPEAILSMAEPFGINRICLVQMSFYGTDNNYITDAIKKYPESFRGAAYLDPDMQHIEDEMNDLLIWYDEFNGLLPSPDYNYERVSQREASPSSTVPEGSYT